MTPRDLDLPFESFRSMQLETACQIAATDKEFVILQAPPGSGKSLLALAAARLMQHSPRTIITVGTKQLQEQYQETLGIPTVMGRSNFLCPKTNYAATCEFGPCNVGRGCSKKQKWLVCPYYIQKLEAIQSRESVLNMPYFLHEANHIGAFSRAQFLVLDEAHLLEDSLSKFIGIKFSSKGLQSLGISFPRGKLTFQKLGHWAEAALETAEDKLEAQEERLLTIPGIPGASEVKVATQLQGLIFRLTQLIGACQEPGEWVIYQEPFSLEVKPIYVSAYAQSSIFRHGDKKLLMSATILDWQDLASTLGIDYDKVLWLELPATFPAENRPVNYWPVAKVKGQEIDQSLDKLVLAIDQILEMFPNEKGVVHAVSNLLTKSIVQRSKYRDRMMHHLHKPREEVIREFIESNKPQVLVSPSVTIGLDLPDDAGRFQIIAKLQFPNMGDPIVQARLELSDTWYAAQTARALIQSTGRVVRHTSDHGVNFILDQNFNWFSKKYAFMIPQWWRDSLFKINDVSQAILPLSADKPTSNNKTN